MKIIVFLGGIATAVSAFGHPGGLDAQGCHNNRKTGGYHCHRAQLPPPKQSGSSGVAQSAAVERPGSPTCYTGPRGGTYTITKSGRKNYAGC